MNARPVRHLLGIDGLSKASALSILDTARAFWEMNRRPVKKAPTLRGKTLINVFFENSTRTRTSFELAGKRLSADVVNINVAQSSAKKGETLRDTISTLDAMSPDLIVIRHAASGATIRARALAYGATTRSSARPRLSPSPGTPNARY